MTERHDLWKIADALQMDLRAASAKLVELRAHLATLDLPDPTVARCPHCQIDMRGPLPLAEHIYHSHNGPVPPHWQTLEARIQEPA